jgi:hypothetical protein
VVFVFVAFLRGIFLELKVLDKKHFHEIVVSYYFILKVIKPYHFIEKPFNIINGNFRLQINLNVLLG